MTPKEKAEDLINSFYYSLPNNGSEVGLNSTTERYEEAIQCALIAVDEIMSLMIKFHNRHIEDNSNEIYFWEEVKNELNK
jgi:hypothetical protein